MIVGRPRSLLGDVPTQVAVGGYAGVRTLQEALRRLAFNLKRSDVDPHKYDGTMTLGTIVAVANAASAIGAQIHPVLGAALDLVELIKEPFKPIPYGETVMGIALSPWLIDKVYAAIIGIVKLFPGGGSAAAAIDKAIKTFESALAQAAAPLATAVQVAVATSTPTPPTVTPTARIAGTATPNPTPGFTWVAATSTTPGHWERLRAGQTPVPGPGGLAPTITVRDHTTVIETPNQNPTFTSSATFMADMKASYQSRINVVRAPWPAGKKVMTAWITDLTPQGGVSVVPSWSFTQRYEGVVPFNDLDKDDRSPIKTMFGSPTLLAYGTLPFKSWGMSDGSRMGAFYDIRTSTLKIKPVPYRPSPKGHWYDGIVDAVEDLGALVAEVGGDIEDAATASWDWISDNASVVYDAVKKYGCALVNNDIVVGLAAAGAGIVASPAASAAVVSGAATGAAACVALTIGEAVYAIIKFLSMKFDPPAPLDTATPPLILPIQIIATTVLQPVMPNTPPGPPRRNFPNTCLTRFNTTHGTWSVYCPVGTVAPANGFGDSASNIAPTIARAAPPWYQDHRVWAALGASTSLAIVGGVAIGRRRRSR